MAARLHGAEPRRRRVEAILVASIAPAAIDASRDLARGNQLEPAYLAFLTLGTLLLLSVLTAIFDRLMTRRMATAPLFSCLLVAAVVFGAIEGIAALGIAETSDLPLVAREHRTAAILLRMGAVNGLIGLGLWAMAVVFPFAVHDAHARAAEIERLRTSAELAHLRAKLQPHFIFNTLSTVAGLVGDEPREARRLIGALGDLLRDSLGESEEMQTLDDEVSWLKRYADILETRHRGTLTFQWDIEEATRSVRIPRLLLQPLLENAVKHGALRRPEGGEVLVRAMIDPGDGSTLRCIVEDNGPGPPPAIRPDASGLKLVTRRLAVKYAGAATLRLESSGGRTRSIVEIPAGKPAEAQS